MRHLLLSIAIVSVPVYLIQLAFPILPIMTQITGWIALVSSLGWLGLSLIYVWTVPQYSCYNCGKDFRTIDQQQDHFQKHLCSRELPKNGDVK